MNGTLSAFLVWAATSAGAGVVLAWLIEYVPFVGVWVQTLAYEWKRVVVLAICLALPLVALALSVQLGYSSPTPDAVFASLSAGFVAYASSQVTHGVIRKPDATNGA